MFDGDAFGAEMTAIVKDAINQATAPLLARLAVLEAREVPTPRDGRDGQPGRDGKDGADGRDGKDGVDGITPTFIDAEFVGRTLRLSFDGGQVCEFRMATPEYAGVYAEGKAYEPGDMVSWGGSVWHCAKDTTTKPGEGEDWTLAVKRGRDGKDKV